jgi:transglutaminase-like putative cysteine protease
MAVVILENDYSPPAQAYYFRQEAWSQFNGTRLVTAEIDGADSDTLAQFPTRRTEVSPPPPAERRTVRARVAMLVEHQQPFALESPVSFEPISNPNPERFQVAYRFESLAQETEYGHLLRRTAGDPEWSEEMRAMYLEGHPDPRFQELTDEILADQGRLPVAMREDPFARALTIKLYLDHELIYSTAERHANVPDPTIDFLFGNRTGYCVHFAHAAVFLWRAAGIPARIGTGYMVPEENRRGGSSILVRSGDAHAWPELYLEGVGWVVLDIAAERNLDQAGQPVDDDLQRMLGEMAREEPPNPEDEVRDEPEEEPSVVWLWITDHLWHILGTLALAILMGLYSIKLWRRVAPAFATATTMPKVGYRAVLDKLAEVGWSREFGETREDFARRVGEVAPSFAELTALHVAARLGDPARPTRPEHDRARWRALMKSGRREIAKQTKLWRRIVGWFHPVSFLDAK